MENQLSLKIEGAEYILSILIERGTIKLSESEKLLEIYYKKLQLLMDNKA